MPLTTDNGFSYRCNDKPKCPYCDSEFCPAEHSLYQLYSEDYHKIDCPFCNKEIFVTTQIKITFDTDVQDEDQL